MITGEAKKVDDVFKAGVSGAEINIRDSEAELFDSSGNPLLNNLVEFEEVVDNSNDPKFLRELSAKVPKENQEMKKMVNERLEFLDELEQSQKRQEPIIQPQVQQQEKVQLEQANIVVEDTTTSAKNTQEYRDAQSNLSSTLSKITQLELRLEKVEAKLRINPTDEDIQELYDNLNLQLANAQAEESYYRSIVESLGTE
jgi:DNA repair exonuclease SbcCD ATPase subunit